MPSKPAQTEKACQYCGETMVWSKANAVAWATLKYCSNACLRRHNRELRQQGLAVGNEADDRPMDAFKTQRFRKSRLKRTMDQ